jgi:hypothetical protein
MQVLSCLSRNMERAESASEAYVCITATPHSGVVAYLRCVSLADACKREVKQE